MKILPIATVPPAGVYADIAVTSPANQAKTAGSTSASISFATPTGGSGSFTGALSISQTVGSGASVGGTPSSASVSSLEDGDVVVVSCTWTDSATGRTKVATCTVAVQTAVVGGEWTSTTYDFSDITAGSTTSVGTFTVYKADGTTVLVSGVARKETGSPGITVTWDTNGIGLALGSSAGSVLASVALDLSSLIPSGRYLDDGPVFVRMVVDNEAFGSSGGGTVGLMAGVASQSTTPATGNVSGAVYPTRLSGGTYQEQARRVMTGTASLGSAQDNSSTVRTSHALVCEIIGGRITRVSWEMNATAQLGPTTGGSDHWDLGQSAVNPFTPRARDISTGLFAFIAATVGSGATAAPSIRIKALSVHSRTPPTSYPS